MGSIGRLLRSGGSSAQEESRPQSVRAEGLIEEFEASGKGWFWETTRDGIHVKGRIEVLGDACPVRRVETMRVRLDVKDPRRGGARTIESRQPLRTYTPDQALALVSGAFEVAGIFDRRYDLDQPVRLEKIDGSAVFVLRPR